MFISKGVSVVVGIISRQGEPLVPLLAYVVQINLVHLLAHLHPMYKGMRELATSVLLIVITVSSQIENDLLCSLSLSPNLFMKPAMGIFVISGNLLVTNCYFACVGIGNLESDINLKLTWGHTN